jgi:hypothetical protein
MDRNIQKIFARSLMILFFIIAPILVLYGMGYRLSRDNNDSPILTSTGGVRINTKIAYEITINDKLESKSPLLKVGLAPQDLNIVLSLPGYQSWAKKISIQPSFVQLISDVTLFPEKPELEKFSDLSTARNIQRVPDASSILYTSYNPKESGLWILNLDTKIRKRLTDSVALGGLDNQDYSDFAWDNTGNILSFKTSLNNVFQYFVITNIDTTPILTNITNQFPIADTITNPIKAVGLDADTLTFIQGGSLYKLTQQFSVRSDALVANIVSSAFVDNTIYYTSDKDNNIDIIRIYNLDTKKNTAVDTPDIGIDKIFVSPNQGHILILDDKQHTWLKSLGDKTPGFNQISDLEIKNIQFSLDSKKALLKGKNSLSILYLDTIEGYKSRIEGDFDTLYTSENPITQAELWEPNSEYVLFIENNTLKVVESDTRGLVNSYTLLDNVINTASIKLRNDAKTIITNTDNIIQYFSFPIRTPLINLNN